MDRFLEMVLVTVVYLSCFGLFVAPMYAISFLFGLSTNTAATVYLTGLAAFGLGLLLFVRHSAAHAH